MGFRSALKAWLVAGVWCALAMASAAAQTEAGIANARRPAPAEAASAAPDPSLTQVSNLNRLAGLRVRDIQFRGTDPQQAGHLRELLAQKADEPLDKQKLRRSIQSLFATGRFADIQVEADRTPQNELTLVFIAEENSFVGRTLVIGAPRHGPNGHQLLNSSKLLLGELYTPQKLKQALESMVRVLQANGFCQATIAPQYTKRPESQQIEITFWVKAGEQARIGKVTVEGPARVTAQQVMEIAHMHPGDDASSQRVENGLRRLRKHFQKQDHVEAQVSLISPKFCDAERNYHADNNTLDYAFSIQPGPAIEIRVEGASVTRGVLKKYIPVFEENAVDDDLLNEGRRNLRDYFQSRGYFDVTVDYSPKNVDYSQKLVSDRYVYVYDVNRGMRHKLVKVDVDWSDVVARPNGEPYFKADVIRERMLVQPAGRVLSHGLFSQSLLTRDQQAIEYLYKSNGFLQVKVTSDVQDDYQGDPGRMRIVVHIAEGSQTRVASLALTGNDHIPADQIRGLISTLEGQPWSEANIAADREAVTNYYFNHGFPEVECEATSAPQAADPTRVDVKFQISEGRQVFVDKVLVTGLQATRPFVVDREIAVHPGDPLNQSAMFDSQRNLYDLGIFNEVDVAVQNPEGDDTRKNMLFDIKEARRWTFNYGFGLEVQTGSEPNSNLPQGRTGVSPRVSFDLTRINFRGRNHTLLFKSHVGRLEQRALFTYEAPRWFDRKNLTLSFISFYDNTNDIRTFTSQRLEGAFQLEHRWSRATTFLYRFSYREVKATNLVIDQSLVPLFSKPVRIGMPSFTFIRDTRDNPLDSKRGLYTTLDMGVSSRFFGSQASFLRFLTQNSTYHAFSKGRIVLARSTRFGIEHPLATSTLPEGTIPLPELLFAGGGNSHRGFSINQAGPRDLETGFPLGGQAMFINNVELRLPPPWLPWLENKVSPVLFYDIGNVFASPSDMFHSFFKTGQNNLSNCQPQSALNPSPSCDFSFMSHALGGGIRYNTPIGPVRLDFGYNLNPPTFLVQQDTAAPVQQLRHFNFFFSIGQTF